MRDGNFVLPNWLFVGRDDNHVQMICSCRVKKKSRSVRERIYATTADSYSSVIFNS